MVQAFRLYMYNDFCLCTYILFCFSSVTKALLEDIDLVGLVQTFITKCMKSDDICNEFYLQLIKQTTDTPPGELLRHCPACNQYFILSGPTFHHLPPHSRISKVLSGVKLHENFKKII